MNKQEFLELLKKDNVPKEQQLEVCQFFIDNFPVFIEQVVNTPFGKINTGQGFWTALPNYKVKDDKIAMGKLEENYQKLVKRIKELEEYV